MIRTSFPSLSSAYAMASCDPIESPSGLEWEVSRNRRRASTSSRMRARSTWAGACTTAESFILVSLVPNPVGSGIGIAGCASRRGFAAFRSDVLQDLLDAIAAFDGFVEDELE